MALHLPETGTIHQHLLVPACAAVLFLTAVGEELSPNARNAIPRVLIGVIGFLLAACLGIISLLFVGLSTPILSHESGEGLGDLIAGLLGVAGTLMAAGAGLIMWIPAPRAWRKWCGRFISATLGTATAYCAWASLVETSEESGRFAWLASILALLTVAVVALDSLDSRSVRGQLSTPTKPRPRTPGGRE